MPFKITIEETKQVTKTVGKDYTVIGERAEFPKEASGMFAYRDAPEVKDGCIQVNVQPVKEYGYSPETEKTVDVTTKVYEQTVEALDLPAVIKAVNNLP